MVIDIHSSFFSEVLDTLAEKLGTHIQSLSTATVIPLPAAAGSGTIKAMRFSFGLNLLCWHLNLKEDLTFYIEQNDRHPLRLLFCEQGRLTHSLDAHYTQYQLEALSASVSACSGTIDEVFHLSGRQTSVLYMVEVDRKVYQDRFHNKYDIDNYSQLFCADTAEVRPFLYQGHYSQAVSEVLRELKEAEHYYGIVRQTFLESKTLELFSLLVQQCIEDQQALEDQVMLSESDVKKLTEARRYVVEHFAHPPSIRQLARQFGLNEFKLKKGYKQLFRATIYEHIREERLYQARQLIAQGKWDIGEVVRRIGYTNKSHFSNRFEERFGLKPKEYQKRACQSMPVAVDEWGA